MTYSGRAIRRSDVLPVRLATAASSRTGARQLWRWWMALALLLLACDAALGSAAFGTGHSPAVSAGPATSAYSYEVEHCEADCSYDPVQHVAIPRASATAVGGSAAARQAGGHQVPTNGLAGFASPGFAAEDDVALGLSHSPAGNGPLLRPFADGLGAKTWTDPAFDDLVSLRQQGATWESISEKIIDRTVGNGGKLHFNLAELDPKRVGITTHELRYVCASPALRAATTFYGGGSPC